MNDPENIILKGIAEPPSIYVIYKMFFKHILKYEINSENKDIIDKDKVSECILRLLYNIGEITKEKIIIENGTINKSTVELIFRYVISQNDEAIRKYIDINLKNQNKKQELMMKGKNVLRIFAKEVEESQ
ncbi:hypothetical protein BCR36DRAFT_587062 [Piromyces finnis]|uniref:Uncharacterized protein n=1 Tax=Piromyces finnis TaxID=1754191 RepID=A0A1Y1UX57_9FUNG|nr:hypothetical protein BCR36DRAFT_587062 [Piromyces finnis]|eukprot:ORX42712.1 hypothetical protein BCR36DRAFT_587062 [Piromyces finnis]